MVEQIANWCYWTCDSVVLPLMTVATATWTIFQEVRHQKEKKKESN